MAATISHKVAKMGYGLTLDFKHACDTVDIGLMRKTLDKLLPESCRKWYHLLTKQWMTMARWIIYSSVVDSQPLFSSQGLPQQNPGAPLMMTLLIFALKMKVEQRP